MTKRTWVVTGGSRGIGRAAVERAAAAGHRVIACARDQTALEEVTARLEGAEYRVLDVTDPVEVGEVLGALEADVLVANAGIATSTAIPKIDLDTWRRVFEVNVTGSLLCTQAVLDGMRIRGWGRIIFMASVASHQAGRYMGAYAASKHAQLGLMRAIAAEVAGSGVTANAVCPSYVDTDMTTESMERIVRVTGRTEEEAMAALVAASALGRLVTPAEVAAAVEYLASDEAAPVNGQSIVIDGGGFQK